MQVSFTSWSHQFLFHRVSLLRFSAVSSVSLSVLWVFNQVKQSDIDLDQLQVQSRSLDFDGDSLRFLTDVFPLPAALYLGRPGFEPENLFMQRSTPSQSVTVS